jgi:rhodanese-related sulfurtransferase
MPWTFLTVLRVCKKWRFFDLLYSYSSIFLLFRLFFHPTHFLISFRPNLRFPYEYEGGHITGAVNIYTKDQVLKDILPNEPCVPAPAINALATKAGTGGEKASVLDSSTLEASPENGDSNPSRTILIFHCEFSSERGPSL